MNQIAASCLSKRYTIDNCIAIREGRNQVTSLIFLHSWIWILFSKFIFYVKLLFSILMQQFALNYPGAIRDFDVIVCPRTLLALNVGPVSVIFFYDPTTKGKCKLRQLQNKKKQWKNKYYKNPFAFGSKFWKTKVNLTNNLQMVAGKNFYSHSPDYLGKCHVLVNRRLTELDIEFQCHLNFCNS